MAQKSLNEERETPPQRAAARKRLAALFAAVTAWAAATAYFQVFTLLPPYDDEGYLMITVRQFFEGHALYRDVYTQYGPVYYFFQWLVRGGGILPVTHDSTRFITLLLWIAISLSSGFLVYRLTRSALAAAGGYALAFLMLFRTAYEPGHPQELCGLLLVTGLLHLTGKKPKPGFSVRLFLFGAVVALLTLTKINLGVFLGLGAGIAMVAASPAGAWRRFGLVVLSFAAAILPFALFRDYLSLGWSRLAVAVAAGIFGALFVLLKEDDEPAVKLRDYPAAAAGFASAAALVSLVVLASGAGFDAFLNGVFLQHFKFGGNFFQAAPIQRFASVWAIAAFAAAVFVFFYRKRQPDLIKKAAALMKLFFGLGVALASFAGYFYFLNAFLLLSFATPLLWLMLLNDDVREEPAATRLARIALVLTATVEPLQIFPIAGTQMNYGAFLMTLVGVVALCDAGRELRTLSPAHFSNKPLRAAFAGSLVLVFAVYMAYRTTHVYRIYAAQTPLSLAGAERLRLPEEDVALYKFLVANLRAGCDDLVSIPGIYSLNFWAGIDPPTTYNATALLTLLDGERQRAIVEKLRSSRRGCVVYNEELTGFGLRGRRPEEFPLAAFALSNYQPVAEWRGYKLLTGAGNRFAPTDYARASEGKLEIFTADRKSVARAEIYDWREKRVLAEISDLTAVPAASDDRTAGAVSPRQMIFPFEDRPPETPVKIAAGSLLVRLYDADGRRFASLPLLGE